MCELPGSSSNRALFLKSSVIIAARKAVRKRIAGRESVKKGRLPKRVERPVLAEMVENHGKDKGKDEKGSPKKRQGQRERKRQRQIQEKEEERSACSFCKQ